MKLTDVDTETSIKKLQQLAKLHAKQKDKDFKDAEKYTKEVRKLQDRIERIERKYMGLPDTSAYIAQRIGEIILADADEK